MTKRAGLVTLVKKTMKASCSGRADDLSKPPDCGYIIVEEVSIRLSMSSEEFTAASPGIQMYVFQTAGV